MSNFTGAPYLTNQIENVKSLVLKFVFSKKATKIDEIFTINWHYVVIVKLTVKISSVCSAFLENMNFKRKLKA